MRDFSFRIPTVENTKTMKNNHQSAENEPKCDSIESSAPDDDASDEKSLLSFIQKRPRRESPPQTVENIAPCSYAAVPTPERLDEFNEDEDSRAAIRLGGNGF